MFYESVFAALNRARVRYLVIGGLAVNLHGVPRTTADLDIVVYLGEKNLARFIRVMESLDYQPTVPVALRDFASPEKRRSWQREKGMVVFSLARTDRDPLTIDVMIDLPVAFDAAWRRRVAVHAGGVRVPVMGIEDMIRLKQLAARDQDLADIEALRRVIRLNGKRP